MPMAKRKFGKDDCGKWIRDENGLPCYVLDLCRLAPFALPMGHILGTGLLRILVDHRGAIRLFACAGGSPVRLTAAEQDDPRNLLLSISCDGRVAGLPCGSPARDQRAVMTWGVGYCRYEIRAPGEAGDSSVDLSFHICAPLGETACLLELSVNNPGNTPCRGTITVALPALPTTNRSESAHGFHRNGTAILPAANERLGDVFLAGDESFGAAADGRGLILHRVFELQPGKSLAERVVAGYSTTCTMAWLAELRQRLTCEDVRRKWADRVNAVAARGSELWMQEESAWHTGRSLAAAAGHPRAEDLHAPADGPDGPRAGLPTDRRNSENAVRDLLLLTLPSVFWEPRLALGTLLAVTACQSDSGRIPAVLGGPTPDTIDPRIDPGDLEVWLLTAWMHYLAVTGDTERLKQPVPFRAGSSAPVWEHLGRAVDWIRSRVGVGPHGLMRMLAGDAGAYLDRCGVGGVGESVLNSAVMCFALTPLVALARRHGNSHAAVADWSDWQRRLRSAVEDAFRDGWFCRGFTDSGRGFGDPDDGRAFADVQAWAVLARCGTARQREEALAAVFAAPGEGPVRTITRPYPLHASEDLSSHRIPPGYGANGGVSLPEAAWFLWAMASIGKTREALAEWEKITVRRRAAERPDLPAGYLTNLSAWALPHSGLGRAVSPVGACLEAEMLPTVEGGAWIDFALRRILQPEVRIPPGVHAPPG